MSLSDEQCNQLIWQTTSQLFIQNRHASTVMYLLDTFEANPYREERLPSFADQICQILLQNCEDSKQFNEAVSVLAVRATFPKPHLFKTYVQLVDLLKTTNSSEKSMNFTQALRIACLNCLYSNKLSFGIPELRQRLLFLREMVSLRIFDCKIFDDFLRVFGNGNGKNIEAYIIYGCEILQFVDQMIEQGHVETMKIEEAMHWEAFSRKMMFFAKENKKLSLALTNCILETVPPIKRKGDFRRRTHPAVMTSIIGIRTPNEVAKLAKNVVEKSSSSEIEAVASEISSILTCCESHVLFEKCIFSILQEVLNFVDQPEILTSFIKLMLLLDDTHTCGRNGGKVTVSSAVKSCFANFSPLDFDRTLRLADVFFENNLLTHAAFRLIPRRLKENQTEAFFKVLRIVDKHLLSSRWQQNAKDDAYWPPIISRLVDFCEHSTFNPDDYIESVLLLERVVKKMLSKQIASKGAVDIDGQNSAESIIKSIGEALDLLEKPPPSCLEEVSQRIASLLSTCSNKTRFNVAVFSILRHASRSFGSTKFQAFEELLRKLSKESPAFQTALVTWAGYFPPSDFEENDVQIEQFFSDFPFICRMVTIGLVNFEDAFGPCLGIRSEKSCSFSYRLMRNFDAVLEDGSLMPQIGEKLAKLLEKVSHFVKETLLSTKRDSFNNIEREEILKFIDSVEQNGGWNRPREKPAVESQSSNSSKPLEPSEGLTQIIDSISLRKSVDPEVVCSLVGNLHSQEESSFSKAVFLLMDKVLQEIESDETLANGANLCCKLKNVTCGFDQVFTELLQQYCLSLYYEIDSEQVPDGDSIRKKCPRLVGRLYALNVLPFDFVLSFMEVAGACKRADALEGLSQMLLEIGPVLASQVQANNMSGWWHSYFEELEQIEMPENVKAIARKIASSEMNAQTQFRNFAQSEKPGLNSEKRISKRRYSFSEEASSPPLKLSVISENI